LIVGSHNSELINGLSTRPVLVKAKIENVLYELTKASSFLFQLLIFIMLVLVTISEQTSERNHTFTHNEENPFIIRWIA
jgi:hypothetical protein